MPYFSNKTSDPAVDGHARFGGRLFAQALETLYGLVAELEVDEFRTVPGRLSRMADLLDNSVAAYHAAAGEASRTVTDLSETVMFGEERERLSAAAELLGIVPSAYTDRDIYLITVDVVAALRDVIGKAVAANDVGFTTVEEVIRAAGRAQEVGLAATVILSRFDGSGWGGAIPRFGGDAPQGIGA